MSLIQNPTNFNINAHFTTPQPTHERGYQPFHSLCRWPSEVFQLPHSGLRVARLAIIQLPTISACHVKTNTTNTMNELIMDLMLLKNKKKTGLDMEGMSINF